MNRISLEIDVPSSLWRNLKFEKIIEFFGQFHHFFRFFSMFLLKHQIEPHGARNVYCVLLDLENSFDAKWSIVFDFDLNMGRACMEN